MSKATCYNLEFCIDGQKVAKRLSKQIGKESTKVKPLLEQYNACSSILSHATGSLQDALDPAGVFWTVHSEPLQLTLHSCDSSAPLLEKQDLVSYCLQKQRSTEEIEMLQAEMLNTLEYFWTCRTKLEHKIQKLLQEDQTDFVRVSISVLYKQYAGNEFIFNNAITAFNGLFLQECQCHHYMIHLTTSLMIQNAVTLMNLAMMVSRSNKYQCSIKLYGSF